MWDESTLQMLLQGVGETLYMTLGSTLFAYILGLPLGVLLVMWAADGIRPHPVLYKILDVIVNLTRSFPFIILLIAVLPFTRWLLGTTLGPTAVIVPLTISAAPFVARLVEGSLKEVDVGVIEASQSMGASALQIIWKVLLPEARPSLILNCAIAITTILGYTAMAGFVGGGLGDIAIRFGYYRREEDIMLVTVVLLIVVVQVFQGLGLWIARRLDRRK